MLYTADFQCHRICFTMNLVLCSVLVLFSISLGKCAKILGIFPAPGYSQFILGEKLMCQLAARGHDVTVISPFRPKIEVENYRTISTDTILNGPDHDFFKLGEGNMFVGIMSTYLLGNFITEHTLQHKNVQALLHSNETFDLVVLEHFFIEAMTGFAEHFGAPLVLFSSIGPTEFTNHIIGNPSLPSITAVCYAEFTNHMTFFERIINSVGLIFNDLYRHYVAFPAQAEMYYKYFPKPTDFNKIIYNASLLLLNSHVTTSDNHALVNGAVEIGGFHVDAKPLDEDIQKYLDEANDGAIYFSLGTNLKFAHMKQEQLKAILKVLSKLKQKILWKFDADLDERPKNVFISKWFKQSDILAHPNVQLFITHGGLLSLTEAVFHGVPMLGIPIFGDQPMNMARAKRNGIANVLALSDLNEERFFDAITDIINNPRYQENSRRFSNLMRDNVVRPLELAMFSIEHVLRNGGDHFKPSTLNLHWYQLYMLDVIGFLIAISVILYILLKVLVKLLTVLLSSKVETQSRVSNTKKNKKQKKY